MCRGVTRLDGVCGKKQVWRPHVWAWGLTKANLLFWKIAYDIVVTFSPPQWFRTRGIVPPYPSLRLWWYTIKIGKFSDNKQISCPNVMNFYSMNICNIRTLNGMDLAQADCQRRSLAAFHVSSRNFVSLLCLPHGFFRRGPVFVLLIVKLFRHSTSYFFKVI